MSDQNRLDSALAGRYRIDREIGAGGMATVYLARDLKHDRNVAIKVLREDLGAILGRERFLAEIRTTAGLQHPHILPLLDSGEAGGLLFYVMPFVAGETLRARLDRESQLPVPETIRIAVAVTAALGHAHAHDVIHRDIKPENILLGGAPGASDSAVLVTDFGIARSTAAAGERLTGTGISIGTAQYMSPEQATGEREIDARSDIYSLGCVAYEMLAGEPPFSGTNPRSVLAKQLSEPVPSVARLREAVPAHIDAAIATALRRDAVDRFATAADFSAALLTPGTGVRRSMALGRPSRRAIVAGAVIGVSLLAGAAWWTTSQRGAPRAPSVRIEHFTSVDGDTGSAYLAATLEQDAAFALASSKLVRVHDASVAGAPAIILSALVRRIVDSVVVRARITEATTGAITPITLTRSAAALSTLPGEIASATLRALGIDWRSASDNPLRDPVAWDLFLHGRYQADRRTESALIRSIADFRAAIARDSGFADAWGGLARALWYSKTLRYRIPGIARDSLVSLLVQASDRAIEADSTSAYAWVARGLALREIDFASRRNQVLAFQRARALDPRLADAWYFSAVAWEDSLTPREGLAAFRRALEIEPEHRQAIGMLSQHFLWARQFDSAAAWADHGEAIDPTHLLIRAAAGEARLALGDLRRAGEEFLAAVRLAQGSDQVHGWAGLAAIAWRENDRRAADTLLAHAIAAADTVRPSVHDAAYLAWAYAATDHHADAIRLLQRFQPRRDMHFQVHLQRDPTLDPLRSDPAFVALLTRPEAGGASGRNTP